MASPITSNMGIPSCSVIVGGKDVGTKYGLKSIVVSKEINKVSKARIIIMDGNPSDETFEASASKDFDPDKTMTTWIEQLSNNGKMFIEWSLEQNTGTPHESAPCSGSIKDIERFLIKHKLSFTKPPFKENLFGKNIFSGLGGSSGNSSPSGMPGSIEEMQKMMGKLPIGGGVNKFSSMGLPGFSGKPSKRIK